MRLLPMLLTAALVGRCSCDDGNELIVNLRTDFVPGLEFTSIRTKGYGAGPVVQVCPGTPGYVGAPGDCYDDDRNVRPGQPLFFPGPYAGGSFDYDCNGREELEPPPPRASCRASTTMCTDDGPCGGGGWDYSSPGMCGEVANHLRCFCDLAEMSCDASPDDSRVLRCR